MRKAKWLLICVLCLIGFCLTEAKSSAILTWNGDGYCLINDKGFFYPGPGSDWVQPDSLACVSNYLQLCCWFSKEGSKRQDCESKLRELEFEDVSIFL